MFIIDIQYKKPLEEVDMYLKMHREYIKTYFLKGIFLDFGPKAPREGGIILADHISKCELKQIISEDPFKKYGIATFQIIEYQSNISVILD